MDNLKKTIGHWKLKEEALDLPRGYLALEEAVDLSLEYKMYKIKLYSRVTPS